MTSEQHRAMRERIGADLAGRLPHDERLLLAQHLAGCEECRAERHALVPMLDALRTVDPERIVRVAPEPSPDLIDRILVRTVDRGTDREADARTMVPALRRRPAALERSSPPSLDDRRARPWARLIVAMAAAVALLAVGVGIGSQAFPRAAPGAPFETVAFDQAPPGVDASGRLIAHTWGTEIQLIVTGLVDGEEYRASFYGDDGVEIDAGTFIGVTGPMVCNLNAAILRPEVRTLRITTGAGATVLEADLSAPAA
jgi:hypothetical protein